MPIVEYRVAAGRHTEAEIADLLQRSCAFFAEVLESPIGRVRAVAIEFRPELVCVGGQMMSDGAAEAPYFTLFLMLGRPEEHRHRLLAGFTDLLVECLGADRSLVRGGVHLISPDDWGIAGTPAAVTRKAEVEARAAAGRQGS